MTISGATAQNLTISGRGKSHLFVMAGNINIDGLTIANGLAKGGDGGFLTGRGGGGMVAAWPSTATRDIDQYQFYQRSSSGGKGGGNPNLNGHGGGGGGGNGGNGSDGGGGGFLGDGARALWVEGAAAVSQAERRQHRNKRSARRRWSINRRRWRWRQSKCGWKGKCDGGGDGSNSVLVRGRGGGRADFRSSAGNASVPPAMAEPAALAAAAAVHKSLCRAITAARAGG